MAEKDQITIQFGAKGDKDVIKAIRDLDRSTKTLIKTQSSLAKEGKNQVRQANSSQKAMTMLNTKLKALGSSFTKAKIDTNLLTRAYKGHKVAIQQVRSQVNSHIKDLKRQEKGLFDTEHGTRILGGSFAVLRSKMLLASFGAGIFSASIGKLTRLFGEQEKAEKKLETAIGKHSTALLAFASAQQKITTFGDEELINAMSLIGAYTDNEKAISRLTQASMDLASAKGMDLTTAVDLVSKSVFSSTNALSRYGIQVEGTSGSVERLQSATENISALYSGQAQASAETFLGSMTQLSNSVGDLGEKFGAVLAPAVLIGARGIKAFTDSISVEQIKAYSTALIGGATAYLIYAKGTAIASKAMVAFNKISKKNIAILAGMLVIGKLIDEFDVFADNVGSVTDEMSKLQGEIDSLNSKTTTSLTLTHQLQMAELNYANTLQRLHPIEKQRSEIALEYNQIRERHGVTEANFGRMMTENTQFAIEYNQNQAKSAEVEQKLQDIRNETIASSLKGFITLAEAQTKNAEKLKILAISQAMIDTMVAANTALKSAPPPLNFIQMAGVVAQGLANVATIQAQKFEMGGLVGGQRHSQGGTLIEAERGEFVMSRQAVESIGLDALNQMNNGIGTGVTVNIQGNMIGNEEFVRDTLIPEINKTVQGGLA